MWGRENWEHPEQIQIINKTTYHFFCIVYFISGCDQPDALDKYSKMCHESINTLQKMFIDQR